MQLPQLPLCFFFFFAISQTHSSTPLKHFLPSTDKQQRADAASVLKYTYVLLHTSTHIHTGREALKAIPGVPSVLAPLY
jgi:hypothetical protein